MRKSLPLEVVSMPRVCTLARSTIFKTYPCYHFSPLQCDRWYVIALHTGSPLSENAYLYLPLSCWLLFEIASFAKMATCSYSELVGGSCSSRKTSGESKCVVLTKCKRDIQGHLKTYKCHDAQLKSEFILLLARAGKYLIIKHVKNV